MENIKWLFECCCLEKKRRKKRDDEIKEDAFVMLDKWKIDQYAKKSIFI